MGWERRGAGGPYFYRSERDAAGKVVKVYVGRGPQADRAAAALAERKARRVAEATSLAAEVARLADVGDRTEELVADVQLLFEATLLTAGYHRRNYGPWRRRRHVQGYDRAPAEAGGPGRDPGGRGPGQEGGRRRRPAAAAAPE